MLAAELEFSVAAAAASMVSLLSSTSSKMFLFLFFSAGTTRNKIARCCSAAVDISDNAAPWVF